MYTLNRRKLIQTLMRMVVDVDHLFVLSSRRSPDELVEFSLAVENNCRTKCVSHFRRACLLSRDRQYYTHVIMRTNQYLFLV